MAESRQYQVIGMDCANDAAEIESAARAVPGVESVKVSVASQILMTRVAAPEALPAIERAVASIGYQLQPLGASRREAAGGGGGARADDDELPKDLTRIPAGYKRALWVVVVLNVGYGVVEVAGGFLADSQALKADALDFLGDGLITFLALLATGWRLAWRSRAALIQGWFLGALGLGVLGATTYRFFVTQQPEAELMGGFAAVALVVNVLAALVLVPYRKGHDSSARAVWRFSAADAVGNAATVAAAGLVAWTGTPWPDLVVAVVVAGLFLRSAWAIVRDARADLRGDALI